MLMRPTWQLWLAGGAVLVYLVAPNLVIVPMSFSPSEFFQFPPPGFSLRWYERFFGDPRWTEALFRSVRVGVAATLIAVVLGTAAAFGLARGRLPFPALLRGFLMAPLVIPYVLMASGFYILFVRLRLVDSEIGLTLAHAVLAIPIVLIAVSSAMRAARRDLERAALSLGASDRQAFFAVTLPLIRPGILTGAVFAFITSFDEVVIAVFIAGVRSTTLPLKMWEGATTEISPVLPAVSTILVGISFVLLLGGELARRRWEKLTGAAAA